jgi:HlyD family secretion protein
VKKLIFLMGIILVIGSCAQKNPTLSASGTIEVREVDVASRIASRVAQILVPDGASVKKDEVLALLDDRLVRAQKESAEALLVNAQDTYNRNLGLMKSGSISRQQFEQAKALFDKAQADYEQAELMFEESRLTAPWDGVILKRHVEVGELVAATSPCFTLGDLNTIKVTIYVPLPSMGQLKMGQTARVSIDSFPKKWYKGTVTWISEKAEFTPKNIQTRDERVKEVFACEVTVQNQDNELKPGMPADVVVMTK